MRSKRRLSLIRKIARRLQDLTESWEPDNISLDLAYLFQAIADNGVVCWDPDRLVLTLLRKAFRARHAVWQFITTDAGDT